MVRSWLVSPGYVFSPRVIFLFASGAGHGRSLGYCMGKSVGGRTEEAGDAVYGNGTRTMKEIKRLILSCLLAYRRTRDCGTL